MAVSLLSMDALSNNELMLPPTPVMMMLPNSTPSVIERSSSYVHDVNPTSKLILRRSISAPSIMLTTPNTEQLLYNQSLHVNHRVVITPNNNNFCCHDKRSSCLCICACVGMSGMATSLCIPNITLSMCIGLISSTMFGCSIGILEDDFCN